MATNRVFIGIGSNLGNSEKYIQQAVDLLVKTRSLRLIKMSSIYETDPVGGPAQGKYLNGVIEIDTEMGPEELLRALIDIEQKLGRVRRERFGPRTIDLDILIFGDIKLSTPELDVPHPRIKDRDFVLKGLCELAPELAVCCEYNARTVKP